MDPKRSTFELTPYENDPAPVKILAPVFGALRYPIFCSYHGSVKLKVIRPSPIDSAELTELRPLSPSALTTGEYRGAVSLGWAFIAKSGQNANAATAVAHVDVMDFFRNMGTPLEKVMQFIEN